MKLAVDDPDAAQNWPRVWFIWRGNAILASAKGHEFFLRHYLGTHDNSVADEAGKDKVKTVTWREPAPRGKMDLVVDINFRMDTSALYSDIVLPAASWYEKNDLNTTDLHSFVHPLSAAVPPVWETKSDWDTFKELAKKVSELAPQAFPEPVRDVVMRPLQHDTPDELAQLEVLDWREGECEPVPGKTMPHFSFVERDYSQLYDKFISLGPLVREQGISANGVHIPITRFYDELLEGDVGGSADPHKIRCVEWGGKRYPSLEDAYDAANVILALAPESNGEIAYAAFAEEEERIGLPLTDLAEENRGVRMTFAELKIQPRRTLTSPTWTGIVNDGRPYAAWTLNVERLVPWRTLTGRQHLYVDHPLYLDFGRAPTGLQAEARRAAARPRGQLVRAEREPRSQLPDAARQVAHPLDLRRHAAHDDALARDRAVLAERQGRGDDRHPGQRLGRGLQRQRRHGHAHGRQLARPAGHVHDLPRARAHDRSAQVAGARRPPRRRAQQPHPGPDQPGPARRRLGAVHVRLQLLGADRLQPRHVLRREEARAARMVRAEGAQ